MYTDNASGARCFQTMVPMRDGVRLATDALDDVNVALHVLARPAGRVGDIGVRRASMAGCSRLASMSARPAWQSIWLGTDGHPAKAGKPLFAIMPMGIAAMDMFVVRLLYAS